MNDTSLGVKRISLLIRTIWPDQSILFPLNYLWRRWVVSKNSQEKPIPFYSDLSSSLHHKWSWTLQCKSICKTVLKFLFWAATWVTGFEYYTMICLLIKPLLICQSGWKEIQKAFPVFRLSHWGPRTSTSAQLRRCYSAELNYISCDGLSSWPVLIFGKCFEYRCTVLP